MGAQMPWRVSRILTTRTQRTFQAEKKHWAEGWRHESRWGGDGGRGQAELSGPWRDLALDDAGKLAQGWSWANIGCQAWDSELLSLGNEESWKVFKGRCVCVCVPLFIDNFLFRMLITTTVVLLFIKCLPHCAKRFPLLYRIIVTIICGYSHYLHFTDKTINWVK